jgi:hypothetical protein
MSVAYSVYHMQRREDFYAPDPLAFRPERWEVINPRVLAGAIFRSMVGQDSASEVSIITVVPMTSLYLVEELADYFAAEDFGLMIASCGSFLT